MASNDDVMSDDASTLVPLHVCAWYISTQQTDEKLNGPMKYVYIYMKNKERPFADHV